jgi:HEPN domain-containing protein/predicted nucleotidyltransferase
MTDALTRRTPQIDDPEALDEVVRTIIDKTRPIAIYLYGSRARDEAGADSDYDLMVVVPDGFRAGSLESYLTRRGHRGRRVRIDVRISRQSSFVWRRYAVGTLEYEVEVDGVELYTSPRTPGLIDGTQPDACEVTERVVREWLDNLERDLAAARACCVADIPDRAVYHLQQAAEKLTKTALMAHEVRPRKGHQIGEFARRIPKAFPLRDRLLTLDRFTRFAWAFRYPDETGAPPEPVPAVSEVEAWIEEIEALKADFEGWLKKRTGAKRKGGGS